VRAPLPDGYPGIRAVVIDSSHHVLRSLQPPLDLEHRNVACFRVLRGSTGPCQDCPVRCLDPRLFEQHQPVTRFERVGPGCFEQVSVAALPHEAGCDRRFLCSRRPVSSGVAAALEELRHRSATTFLDRSRDLLGNKVQALLLGIELLERPDLEGAERNEVHRSLKAAAQILAAFLSASSDQLVR